MTNNKKDGTKFEKEIAEMFHTYKFWVHLLAEKTTGRQPADIIASKNGKTVLIECKTVKDRFNFSRIEDNQRTGFNHFIRCGNKEAFFCFKFNGEIGFISFLKIFNMFADGKTSMNFEEFCKNKISFFQFVKRF